MKEIQIIYAVIVTYNRKDLLNRCLETLKKQTYPIHKVILVDNCSTDQTSVLVKEWMQQRPEWIDYMRSSKNLGGAGGFYNGFKQASQYHPDWIVVMDDDAACEPDYIERLMEVAYNNPKVGCLIGTEYVGYTDRRAYGGRRKIIDYHTLREQVIEEEIYQKGTFLIDTMVFVGPLIRGDILEKVGFPDKEFFIYYDDTDYSLRIRRYTEILCVPEARIHHRTDFENDVLVEGQKEWRKFYMYRNRLMIRKRYLKNGRDRRREMLRCFYHEIKDAFMSFIHKKISIKQFIRSVYVVIRATVDVNRNKLGKAGYVRYE